MNPDNPAEPRAQSVQVGTYIDYTPGSDVAGGTLVDLGGWRAGLVNNDIAANTLGAVQIAGGADLNNEDGTAFAVGVAVGWDATNQKAVTGGTGDFNAGISLGEPATNVVRVLLNDDSGRS